MIALAERAHPSLDAARAAVRSAFAGAAQGRLVAVSFEAPEAPLERFLSEAREAFFLEPFCAAEGIAAEVRGEGPARFRELIEGSGRLFERIAAQGPISPRLLGGFSFRAEESEAEWSSFPAAWLVLPRWTYLPGMLMHAGDDEAAALRELEVIWARLTSDAEQKTAELPRAVAIETEPSLSGWSRSIDEVLAAIASRRADKVVLARSSHLRFDAPLDDRAVLARLSCDAGVRFLIRTAGGSFLGSTPERLIAKHGDRIDADALAGTAGAGSVEELRDEKQLREHAWVVEHIASRLGGFASAREAIGEPAVKHAGSIRHLHTPIRMRARPGVSILELAEALHPTPAVCGAPSSFAYEAIARAEKFARGWYTGAVGWIDAQGDGELYVALRCALLQRQNAYLYAGAGIVAGSRAVDEYLETAMKERVMMRALGAVS